MKQGKYTGETITWHGIFGMLAPEQIYDLPDDWDFEHETLFVPIDAPWIIHSDNMEKLEPAKAAKKGKN